MKVDKNTDDKECCNKEDLLLQFFVCTRGWEDFHQGSEKRKKLLEIFLQQWETKLETHGSVIKLHVAGKTNRQIIS